MCTLAVHWGWRDTVPGFPDRLRENPPRQGFFEHPYAVVVSVVAVRVICLLRLALLGFLALGPVFLHPEAVRLEFPILSLHPGLRPRCVAPDV